MPRIAYLRSCLRRVRAKYAILGMVSDTALAVALAVSSAEASGRPVTFPSLDGTLLAADFYEAHPGRRRPWCSCTCSRATKSDWGSLAERSGGGHHGAGDRPARARRVVWFRAEPVAAMVQDVTAAVRWLSTRPACGPASIGVVGASLGASLALLAAADPRGPRVGLLSPSLDYRGVRIDAGLMKRMARAPMLLAASAEDPLALRTVRDFAVDTSGAARTGRLRRRGARHRPAGPRPRPGPDAGGLATPLVAILRVPHESRFNRLRRCRHPVWRDRRLGARQRSRLPARRAWRLPLRRRRQPRPRPRRRPNRRAARRGAGAGAAGVG